METALGIIFLISGLIYLFSVISFIFGLDFDNFIADVDSFGFFSFRNLNAFILGLSSASYLSVKNGYPVVVSLILGIIFGLVLFSISFLIMKLIFKLQQLNNISVEDLKGIYAQVIVKIPPSRNGMGKILFIINNRYEEGYAITDNESEISKNTQVVILDRFSDGTFFVDTLMKISS